MTTLDVLEGAAVLLGVSALMVSSWSLLLAWQDWRWSRGRPRLWLIARMRLRFAAMHCLVDLLLLGLVWLMMQSAPVSSATPWLRLSIRAVLVATFAVKLACYLSDRADRRSLLEGLR